MGVGERYSLAVFLQVFFATVRLGHTFLASCEEWSVTSVAIYVPLFTEFLSFSICTNS